MNLKTGLRISLASGLLCLYLNLPAYAAVENGASMSLFSLLLFLIGLAIGVFILPRLGFFAKFMRPSTPPSQNKDSDAIKSHLEAIERISQGFNLFLKSNETSSHEKVMNWLMRETATSLDISRASLWFYSQDHSALEIAYCFDARTDQFGSNLTIEQKKHPLFFETLREERVMLFNKADEDDRSADFISVLPEEIRPMSLVVAHIGIGQKAIGTLLISMRETYREWSQEDRQFIGSIADLIAFYFSTRDLKNTRDALNDSEQRFKDLVDASSDWYWESNQDHILSYLSPKLTEITGIPNSFLLNKTRFDSAESSMTSAKWIKHLEDLEHRRVFHNFIYSVKYKGESYLFAVNGKPFFDEKGRFIGYRGTGSDITESITSRNRFEDAINALSSGLLMWDSNDDLVIWNNEAAEYFPGIEEGVGENFDYRDFLDYLNEQKLIKTESDFNENIKTAYVERHRNCGVYEMELSDGRHLLVNEHATSEEGIVGVYTDITKLKSRENELIENNRISKVLSMCGNTLVHARNESFIISEICRIITEIGHFDCAWISVFANTKKLPDYNYIDAYRGIQFAQNKFQPGELFKKLYSERKNIVLDAEQLLELYPDFKDLADKQIKACALFFIILDGEVAGMLAIGSMKEAQFTNSELNLLEELSNDIGYGLSSLKNEHNRQIAEEALRESEARYRSLIDMSPDAILVLDENERIVFCNQAGNALFATQNMDEMFGIRFSNFVIEAERYFPLKGMEERKHKLQNYTSIELKRVNDQIFEADISARPVSYAGLSTRLLIIRDVTERNRVSEQLAQTSKLATLGEMAAGITHELSQPLNIMRFAAEGTLLKLQKGKIAPEKIENQFNLISMQSARMADIIDHMRVFSRKDTGTIELFDPADVIHQAIDLVETQFTAQGIAIEFRYPPFYLMLKGRPIQLEQVILNLLNNARDAILLNRKKQENEKREDNFIDINMTYDQHDNRINIAVSDNGGGIPESVLSKLFDPFFTTKEVGKGTGLGLSVSYGIISAMNGEIVATNMTDGARFDISIPCVSQKLQDLRPRKMTKPDAQIEAVTLNEDQKEEKNEIEEEEDLVVDIDPNALQVLVVDDEVYAAEAMMECLFDHGYKVNMAGDGEEALELFNEDPADLVITDIRMPKMDGHALIRNLKEKDENLPIIVVTGHTGMDPSTLEQLEGNSLTVMKKPVSLSNLISQVEKIAAIVKKN